MTFGVMKVGLINGLIVYCGIRFDDYRRTCCVRCWSIDCYDRGMNRVNAAVT